MAGDGVTLSLWDEAPFFFINGHEQIDDAVIDALDRELSYEVPDAEYTDSWKNGDWDGKHHLLRFTKDDATPFFPIGLIGKAREVLDAFGVEYTVEGHVYPGFGDMDLSWNTDMTLRGYQEDAVEQAITQGSGIVVLPTGGGKTLIGLNIAHRLGHRTLVMCHRTEIADQWAEQIEDILGVEPARYYGGKKETGDVMVALYQSVHDDENGDAVDDVSLDHEVALFDEAHTVGADTFSDVALSIPATYRFGFSATPEREDNATLKVIAGTGGKIADLSAENLISRGYLAEPKWVIKDAPSAGGRCADWQEEYRQEIVENQRRNKMVEQVVDDLPRPVMVTVERVNHGDRLEALIDDAAFVHGDSASRDEDIQAFRDGEIPVLVATRGIVGEGFDVPEIASFVVAGGMKSSTSMIQQVGRALRPETDEAVIVDFWDKGNWVSKHSEKRIRTYREYYGEEYGP